MENRDSIKNGLLGFYDYTVILTYAGLLFAITGIFSSLGERYLNALICLMLAGACDMFDGVVASTKKRSDAEKCFGIQIDSMCDVISSGVFPGLFVYCLLGRTMIGSIVTAFYILCALIRLSYFNVLEEARQKETTEHRSSYLGMPVTTIAALLPAVYLLQSNVPGVPGEVFLVLLVACAVGFLLPVTIKKPHGAGKAVLGLVGIAEMALLLFLR